MSRLLWSVGVLLLILLQYRLWWGENGLLEQADINQQIAHLESKNAKLQSRNQRLQAEVSDLRQGLGEIEERAREELGMIGRDETFFWLVPKSSIEQARPQDDG